MVDSVTDKLRAAKAKAQAVTSRRRPQAYSPGDIVTVKALMYGHSGTGKTFFIVGLLLAGERVFVVSSDFGSNGLLTVRNELERRGRLDLLSGLRVVDIADYEDLVAFFENPVEFCPDFGEFDPSVLDWEGFSSFNIDLLDEYILSMAPGAESAGEMRHEGWTHTKQDWQGMKRGTVRGLRKFLAFTKPNGGQLHKILTCLEAQPDVDDLTQKTVKSVLVHGTGKSLMAPAFDIILETFKEERDGKLQYYYRCEGDSGRYLVKSRGFGLAAIEPADPERVWKLIVRKDK